MTDTGRARLPGLPAVTDSNLTQVVRLLAERAEVREGGRGNPYEAVVTKRDLDAVTKVTDYLSSPKRNAQAGDAIIDLGGGLTASIAVDQLAESIKGSKLFKDMQYKLDDPARFGFLPDDIRKLVTGSVADEAERLGASVTRVENKLQSAITSMASTVEQVTASVSNAQAGVREVTYAYAQADKTQAGKIATIEARLNGVGGVTLEQQMTAAADRVTGLEGKYTLKINAGGAIAGFGLAASSNNGVTSSAFIIQADKFALVSSAYTNGLTNTPSPATVPFGVDTLTNSLYLNGSVYLKGTLKLDSPNGKDLSSGLRGSVTVAASASSWNDNVARAAVNAAIGKSGDLTNNWLIIGDMVTITNPTTLATDTRQWLGSSWAIPGAVINGNLLVDGTIAATKINTFGLTIKGSNGDTLLSSGVSTNWDSILNQKLTLTDTSSPVKLSVGGVTKTLTSKEFVNTLSKINGDTEMAQFFGPSAISRAWIGNLNVQDADIVNLRVKTVNIADNAVTVPSNLFGIPARWFAPGSLVLMATSAAVELPANAQLTAIASVLGGNGYTNCRTRIVARNLATGGAYQISDWSVTTTVDTASYVSSGTYNVGAAGAGNWVVDFYLGNDWHDVSWYCNAFNCTILSTKK